MVQNKFQRVLSYPLYHVNGYTSFYSHETKESHKVMHLLSTLVVLAGKQVQQGREISAVGPSCYLITLSQIQKSR